MPGIRTAPDLVERDFDPAAINRLWSADITYIRTWEGWLYLASVMDCYSRRIVGWALADHLRAELVVDALEMAVARRRPDVGLVHHSDRGSQFTSLIFTRRCRSIGIDISMGSRGDCFDNAVLESFHASLKKDLIHRRSWPTKAEARTAVFDYIEASTTAGAAIRRSRCSRPWSSRTELSGRPVRVSPLRGSHPSTRSNTRQRQRPKPPNNPVSTEPGEVQIYFGDRFPG